MMADLRAYFATFSDPWVFWLLLLIPLLSVWYIIRQNQMSADVKISALDVLSMAGTPVKQYMRHFAFVMRLAALALLIFALARPQSSSSWKSVNSEGIDIVMAVDISASMLAQDLKPDRLEAAKMVASEFIDERPNDRIGLVIFSGESFTQCPLTTDHAVVKSLFSGVETGMIEDGTAIGQGLGNAVARIKDSKAKSKVVILLTDGVNNTGNIAPLTAAEIAKKFGVRVYTIGVGTRGKAYAPVSVDPLGNYQYDYVDVKIDEETMSKIAEMTGGKYFRATDNKSLRSVYKEIDQLEKTIFEERNFTRKTEEFFPYLLAAMILLLGEFMLRNTYLRSIP
jgi:Ca-activated chloride channel family protein